MNTEKDFQRERYCQQYSQAEHDLAERFKERIHERWGFSFSKYPDSVKAFLWLARMYRRDKALNDEYGINKRVDGIYNSMEVLSFTPSEVKAQAISAIKNEFPLPKKGLFIYGPPGTGKSTLANIIGKALNVQVYRAIDVDALHRTNQGQCENDEYRNIFKNKEPTVILDDLDAESSSKQFGGEPPMINILNRLYDFWIETKKPIVITSNITMEHGAKVETVDSRYGVRIGDRLPQMLEPILFNGPSLRKP